ncbi:hypothetical protein V9L05_14090 [Bernardetia sp. Wsw4-3y2]|uniref:hypothetical protein n=1 Tax=Bernardetia sp. Wsw4-3y2 TaxID=3127471 RepID=UPI0030D4F6C8
MAALMMIFAFACSVFLIGVLTKVAFFNTKSIANKEKEEVEELKQRNHELEMRMETLETIVTSIDPELLGGLLEMNSPKKRVPKNVRDKIDKIKKR